MSFTESDSHIPRDAKPTPPVIDGVPITRKECIEIANDHEYLALRDERNGGIHQRRFRIAAAALRAYAERCR